MNNIKNGTIFVLAFLLFTGTFITAAAAGPDPVELLSGWNFAILAKTGISTTGTTSISGNIGISPASATYITGFSLSLPANSEYATSPIVSGKIYSPDYANPTPSDMSTAISNMETAYTDASGRTNPTSTELGAGNIGGLTLAPGLYKWSTNVSIPSDLTLSGTANDVWIFQIAQNLDISSGVKIKLLDSAQPNHIFWIVGGQTTLNTTSIFYGNILDQTSIVLKTGATLIGRAFAQTAVTLDANTIVTPSTITIAPERPKDEIKDTPKINTANNKYQIQVTQTTPSGIVTTNNYNFGNSNLSKGSRGEAVKELQRFLNNFLKKDIKVDGKLGKNTISLIKKWQKDHNLKDDGIIGINTKIQMNHEAEKD